jgi:hypothetical protein
MDLETLYSYEAQIEPAWAAILVARGLNAFIEFSDQTKLTPFVDVTIVHVAPTGHQHLVNWDQLANAGVLYWDAWHARLLCRVYTQRGKNSDQQAPTLGIIRAAAADFGSLLTRAVLPWHSIERFREAEDMALARGYDHVFNLDWSEIRFDLTFSIRTDVW